MTNSTAAVVAGRPKSTGGVYRGPSDATLPTDATTSLDSGLKALGYAGDDGVTETIGRDTDTIKAWGGDVVKIVQTDFSVTYKVTLIESLTGEAMKAVHGDSNVTVTAAGSGHGNKLAISIKSTPLGRNVFVFEIADGTASVRIVIPNGQVINVDDVTYTDDSVVAYPITIQAFPDDSGINAYKYSDDGNVSS